MCIYIVVLLGSARRLCHIALVWVLPRFLIGLALMGEWAHGGGVKRVPTPCRKTARVTSHTYSNHPPFFSQFHPFFLIFFFFSNFFFLPSLSLQYFISLFVYPFLSFRKYISFREDRVDFFFNQEKRLNYFPPWIYWCYIYTEKRKFFFCILWNEIFHYVQVYIYIYIYLWG